MSGSPGTKSIGTTRGSGSPSRFRPTGKRSADHHAARLERGDRTPRLARQVRPGAARRNSSLPRSRLETARSAKRAPRPLDRTGDAAAPLGRPRFRAHGFAPGEARGVLPVLPARGIDHGLARQALRHPRKRRTGPAPGRVSAPQGTGEARPLRNRPSASRRLRPDPCLPRERLARGAGALARSAELPAKAQQRPRGRNRRAAEPAYSSPMKLSFPREIPRRAALVVMALALIASVVAGREEVSSHPQAAPEPAPVINRAPPQASLPALDLDKLNRSVKNNKITDLFASKAVVPIPTPVSVAITLPPPPPPPAPTAPPLPFRYFGKWIEGDRTVVFLWNNSDGYSVAAGDTVEGTYRIEAITDSSVDFIYLPLGSKQTLPIGKPE